MAIIPGGITGTEVFEGTDYNYDVIDPNVTGGSSFERRIMGNWNQTSNTSNLFLSMVVEEVLYKIKRHIRDCNECGGIVAVKRYIDSRYEKYIKEFRCTCGEKWILDFSSHTKYGHRQYQEDEFIKCIEDLNYRMFYESPGIPTLSKRQKRIKTRQEKEVESHKFDNAISRLKL